MDHDVWWHEQRRKSEAEYRQRREREKFAKSLVNDGDRYVFVAPLRCPVCTSIDHETNRTERHDGVKSQRKTCRGCGHKFIAVFQDLES
jgi:hypothetical protein